MHKEPSWRAKAMYLVFACALVFGLAGVVAMPPKAEADIPDPGSFAITGGTVNLTAAGDISGYFTGTNSGIPNGPYYFADLDLDITYAMTVYNGTMWVKAWVQGNRIDFAGEYYGQSIAVVVTVASGGVVITDGTPYDGVLAVDFTGVDGASDPWIFDLDGYVGIPQLIPDIALDVKGATQKFVVVNVPLFDGAGDHAGMSEQAFRARIEADGLQSALVYIQGLRNDAQILEWVITPGVILNAADITIVDGGQPGDSFIKIRSTKPGDVHISATLLWVGPNGIQWEIDVPDDLAEKKWGVIDHTVLDMEPESTETPASPQASTADDVGSVEWFSDFVYAWFYWGEVDIHVDTAGHAIVHWWLIQDDLAGLNEQAILDIMAWLGECPDAGTEPCGCGGYAPFPSLTPKERIDAVWTLNKPTTSDFTRVSTDNVPSLTKAVTSPDGFYWLDVDATDTYIKTVTQDDFPGETRGLTMVEVTNSGAGDILVVTLTEYPVDYHGENPVCIEMGKKTYGVPPPPEIVKTPQVRWAGEKIVLEQDWSNFMSPDTCYVAVYHLEEQSVGEISIAGDNTSMEASEGDIWVLVDSSDSISEVLLETEVQGEADVNVKLYKAFDCSAGSSWLSGPPIVNYGFLVYFLAFEDVVLAEDITPLSGLSVVSPLVDVPVTVQVRGWFKSYEQPGTNRPARDIDGDGIYECPEGRYVLPDDWWGLVGHSYDVYPNMDLMDQAHHDAINSGTSGNPLGPFNTAVWTTDPPNVAQYPSIGPFNTLQRWSEDLMWISEAATVPTSLIGENYRNTVVPDRIMSWYDCPMPQALVNFDITAYTVAGSLSDLSKGDLEGYGYTGSTPKVYHSPFYRAEIPSHTLIPSIDYEWDSWGTTNPYPYWTDVFKKDWDDSEPAVVNDQDVEVYCDNHGIAGVTADALGEPGTITIVATAQFPAALKAGKYAPRSSGEIPVKWGAIELNPHFVADKADVAVEELVTFDNLTTGGTFPYTKAQWDFEADGIIDLTITGTHAQVMADVTHAYSTPGIYTVRLWMTDSTPTTRYEERPTYITVAGGVASHTWTFYAAGFFSAHLTDTYMGSVVLGDLVLGDIPAQVQGVWYYDPAILDYTFWVPGVGGTLTTLGGGHTYDYQVLVNGACTWTIPLP